LAPAEVKVIIAILICDCKSREKITEVTGLNYRTVVLAINNILRRGCFPDIYDKISFNKSLIEDIMIDKKSFTSRARAKEEDNIIYYNNKTLGRGGCKGEKPAMMHFPLPIDCKDLFESFWKIYPRKIGKQPAYDQWCSRLRQGVEVDELMTAVKNFAMCMNNRAADHILHGSTFLGKRERWKDYIDDGAAMMEFKQKSVKKAGRGIKSNETNIGKEKFKSVLGIKTPGE
jgi:hypothetical protein